MYVEVVHVQKDKLALSDHRSINTKKREAGCWQAGLTDCVLGNTVTCQLEKVEGDNSKSGDLKLVNALTALAEKNYPWCF